MRSRHLHIPSICGDKNGSSSVPSVPITININFLRGLFFGPEDRGDMFRYVPLIRRMTSTDYVALYDKIDSRLISKNGVKLLQ